jgi:hypothetical protein
MYEFESFPIHWRNFDRLIDKGKIIAPPVVKNEILTKKHDELDEWCDKYNKMFEPMDDNISKELSFLEETFYDWYHYYDDSKDDWADPHLIAYAKAYNAVLVTQEKCNFKATKQHNYKIPTICAKLGAYCHIDKNITKNTSPYTPFQCINFFELIKREKLYEMIINNNII